MTNLVFRRIIIHIREGCNIIQFQTVINWQIYFKTDSDKEPSEYTWEDTNTPFTIQSAVERGLLKYAEEQKVEIPANAETKTKAEFQQGHRKQLFTEKQKQEIAYKYTHYNTSKSQLARQYKCSEKTIRRVLKEVNERTL